MELETLGEFINEQEGRLKRYFRHQNRRELILANAVKLTEEVGEFCQEALAGCEMIRKEKQANHNQETAENELADVIITTLLLAKSLDLNVNRALENKIKKINQRFAGV